MQVYSLLNNAWESVDGFESGIYIDHLLVANYLGEKRLYAVTKELGACVYEEILMGDNRSTSSGLILPFTLNDSHPPRLLSADYDTLPVVGTLRTRRYTFGNEQEKRFASAQITGQAREMSNVSVSAIGTNPDTTKTVYDHTAPTSGTEDFTARFRVATVARGIEIVISASNAATSVGSVGLTRRNRAGCW